MVPAHPPLPTAWNLPFHPASGNQTSTLMSESLDGRIVAAMRQKAGRPRKTCAAAGGAATAAGGANAPASTTLAIVMVVCGSAIDARLSHEAAAPRVRTLRAAARMTAHSPPARIFIDFTLQTSNFKLQS